MCKEAPRRQSSARDVHVRVSFLFLSALWISTHNGDFAAHANHRQLAAAAATQFRQWPPANKKHRNKQPINLNNVILVGGAMKERAGRVMRAAWRSRRIDLELPATI